MKKYLALILIICLFVPLGLTGCGSNGQSSDLKKVKIAYVGPITGPNAAIGLGMRNSAELAVKQANAKKDLPFELELVVLDDQSDPAVAVNAVNMAASDPEILATVAHFNSGCALATKDVFNKYGLSAVILSAINDKITEDGYAEITRVIAASKLQNTFAGDVAVKDFGVKKIAVIHDQTDYGKTNAEQFIAKAKENGAEMLCFEGIAVGQQDFSSLLTKIKSLNPEMIFFGGLATEAALIKRQMNESDIPAILMSDSGIHTDTFIDIAKDLGEGTLCSGLISPIEDLPKGQDFIKAYEEAKYKDYYEAFGPFAYDATNIVIKALQDAEKLDRESITKAIKSTKDYEGVLGTTTFDESGQTKLNTVITYVVKDGKWVPFKDSGLTITEGQYKK
ncbi:branched-chain amino acid transport system substrate-binding protein [Desulfonispora thiosulfatigenes DSM 11270]|uniref:Branched-chain amino acid transport system substrate-binding protein n=1 Tax=Desulfonispora thiosulfatigenes DSM 11270 TaxID=656914 RepID=A0A1W1VEC2_DESTI|nr:branched-chain amino acid ABC transporter substrate-binding protein [Desulfonispora thiosulfatigenes]SMB91675.1 branched-chain amino acid transport system substrate-binding protein [Desulfonispora thiosulfatigenes DSM 11270]